MSSFTGKNSSGDHAAAQIREAERRVFKKWYATASIGAKLAYWTARTKELQRG